MQLTLFTDYSLRTLMYLSQNKESLSTVKEVAEYYNISRHHLVKIVHNLSHLGYIESVKGKNGGIKLTKEPGKINLRDLIYKLEPNLTLVECFNKGTNTCCVVKACGLKNILNQALMAFMDVLSKHTLADAVNKPELFASLASFNCKAR